MISQDTAQKVFDTSLGALYAGANPLTGDVSLQALGLKYKAGELEHPVEDFVVSGNLLEWLERIGALSSELEWHQSKASPFVEIPDVTSGGA